MVSYHLVFKNYKGDMKYIRIITKQREQDDERKYLRGKIDAYISKHPDYIFSNSKKITCIGCLENIANQEGHISYGGCLYDPENF